MKNRKAIGNLAKLLKYRTSESLRATENKMDISIKLYESIKANNLTLKEFANKTHKSVLEIEHWLDGTHDFTVSELSEIEIVLDVKLLNTAKFELSDKYVKTK